jgi:hypothetical protein
VAERRKRGRLKRRGARRAGRGAKRRAPAAKRVKREARTPSAAEKPPAAPTENLPALPKENFPAPPEEKPSEEKPRAEKPAAGMPAFARSVLSAAGAEAPEEKPEPSEEARPAEAPAPAAGRGAPAKRVAGLLRAAASRSARALRAVTGRIAARFRPAERRAEGPWLEVRPYVGQEARVANFLDFLNAMHGLGGEFEVLIASGPDPEDLRRGVPFPRRVVRHFVRCPDGVSREMARSVLRSAGFAVEDSDIAFEEKRLTWAPNLTIEHPLEAELELEAPYGERPCFPELPTYERRFEQFVSVAESLHSAVLFGGALRIVARRNDRAGVHVKVPGVSRDGRAFGSAASYHLGAFVRNVARLGAPDGVEEVRRPVQPVDAQKLQEAQERASKPWFSCDIRAYGTPEQIRAIASALTFPTNRCRVFRVRRRCSRIDAGLQEGRSYLRLAAVFSLPALLLLLWVSGVRSPLGVLSSPVDQALLGLALLSPLLIRRAWRMRRTVAMTIGELSLLISLPRPEIGGFHFAEARPPPEIREEAGPRPSGGGVNAQKGASGAGGGDRHGEEA